MIIVAWIIVAALAYVAVTGAIASYKRTVAYRRALRMEQIFRNFQATLVVSEQAILGLAEAFKRLARTTATSYDEIEKIGRLIPYEQN